LQQRLQYEWLRAECTKYIFDKLAVGIREALNDIFPNVPDKQKSVLESVSLYLPWAPIVPFLPSNDGPLSTARMMIGFFAAGI